MNSTAQKAHTRVTDDLAERLGNVETVLAALDERVTGVATAAMASVQQERTARAQGMERVQDAGAIRVDVAPRSA